MTMLNELFSSLTVDTLKGFLEYFPDAVKVGKKEILLNAILQEMSDDRLPRLWERLDRYQQLAVAEALYGTEGKYDETRFAAKYGKLPAFFANRDRSYGRMALLGLFLHQVDRRYVVPADMRARLKTFVPVPAANVLATVEAPPEAGPEGAVTTVRETEREAMQDLAVMLRTVDQGQIAVSDKTHLPGGAALRLLAGKLAGGDFYEIVVPKEKWEQVIGPIKALAWPLLLQGAGLAQLNGGKLGLSPAGVKAMSAAPADVLRGIWRKWVKSSLFDEFSRIDEVKGQKGKGRLMSAPAPRRAVIAQVLQRCPVGAWVNTDELSRFMLAEGCEFEVCHDTGRLYFSDPNYGSLEYGGDHIWDLLQFRYLLCLLFEYCATLGMVDVAYLPPDGARDDFGGQWGTEDLGFLSRYDGLTHFRLTALGAYCLGVSDQYTPVARPSTCRLSVQANLHVAQTGGDLSADDMLVLDTWADRETDLLWRLSREKTMAAIERGHDAAQLEAFLQARDSQPLPVQVEGFLRTCMRQGKAMKVVATTLLIECVDAGIADLIAAHKETAGLCLRAGERHVVVRLEQEAKFRKAIRLLGYGCP
jgi:hypothetical protein